jgi:hypothetical protein
MAFADRCRRSEGEANVAAQRARRDARWHSLAIHTSTVQIDAQPETSDDLQLGFTCASCFEDKVAAVRRGRGHGARVRTVLQHRRADAPGLGLLHVVRKPVKQSGGR